jgi:general L-amino acid transport system substrate-binding protein
MIRKFNVLSLLVILALVLAACGGAANTNANADTSTTANNTDAGDSTNTGNVADGGDSPEPAAQTGESILARVLDRGKVVCGGRTDLAGFGYLDADGNNVGFDIDLCRAVAAAVLGDPNAVEIVPLDAADRGPALQTAEVDILSRNVTWTSSRDAQWGNFTIVMFYDGQGFIAHADSGITAMEDMNGASVCVTSGTTTEQNLSDFFRQNNWEYEAVVFADTGEVYGAYEEGRCDVTTSDISQLAAKVSGFADPSAHVFLPVRFQKNH